MKRNDSSDNNDKNENNDDISNVEKDESSFIENIKDFIFKEDDYKYQKFDIKGMFEYMYIYIYIYIHIYINIYIYI
jgi:hypothetical protein